MSTYRRWWQAVSAAFLLVLIITAWIVFAPLQLGGQVAYVIITGNSMEPGFHLGDLVIVRQASVYQVGDIVAYRSAELRSFVFHRIIGLDLDRFILKGDHNTWTDSYQPTREELVGILWIHLPGIGKVVQWLRLPINMALMAGVTGGILTTVLLMGRSKRRRRKSKKSIVPRTGAPEMPPGPGQRARNWGGMMEGMFFVLGLLAFASLVLGFFVFTRPLWRTVADNVNYQQTGTFSYSGLAPLGIYDSTKIPSGQPVFPNLTCILNLQFTYTLVGDELQDISGTHQLMVQVSEDISSWQRTIPVEQAISFSGNSYTTDTIINLCQVEALVETMQQKTEFQSTYYSFVIIPSVTISGKVAGRDLQDTFEPRLVFRFDQLHFFLAREDPQADPLSPSKTGILKGFRTEANTFSLLGKEFIVSGMRTYALIGLGLSLVGMLSLGLFIFTVARRSQESFALMKYGSMLIEVQDKDVEMLDRVIDVITLDDLARLAARNNATILHQARLGFHYYLVQDGGITYRYVVREAIGGVSPATLVQLESDLQQGLERQEFRVHYQPIISLTDGRITGVEALLRWQHPQRGLVFPAEFLPAAEATGMIEPLGEWMLQSACAQLMEWQAAGVFPTLAVNLSKRQLEGNAVEIISRVLQSTGADPSALHIEIPEALAMGNLSKILPRLLELKALGTRISMDDFIGQASLSSFEQFPLNSVKMDRTFVERINEPESAMLVQRMISAALSLGLNVVAVGVETDEQLSFLRSHLCTLAQGYLLGRPAPAQDITQLLLKNSAPGDYPSSIQRSGT